MEAENYYERYLKSTQDSFEKLLKEYHEIMFEVRYEDKAEINGDLRNEAHDKFRKSQNALSARHTFLRDVMYQVKRKRFKNYEEHFIEAMENIPAEEREDFLIKLADYVALDDYYCYLQSWSSTYKNEDEDENISLDEDEIEAEVLEESIVSLGKGIGSNVSWLGTSSTEFIHFVYLFQHAGYLNNDDRKITKLVKQIALLFNFELSENWKELLHNSLNNRSPEYIPKILQRLTDSYKKLKDERIENGKK